MNDPTDDAQLLDSAGNAISSGRVKDFGDGSFSYYPADIASSEAILAAATLELSQKKRRLHISSVQRCQQQVPHQLHFHLRAA